MAIVLANVKRHAAVAAVVAAGLVAALGVVLLLLATRPSRFTIATGEYLYYRLHAEAAQLLDDANKRAPRSEDYELFLVGTGNDNQAVLAVADAQLASVALVTIGSDGAVRTCDAAGRPGDAGVAVGWFDLSLCALPPGSEQTWSTDLVYAALPAHRRAVQAKVGRLRSGASPEFQLKLPPSIEWINQAGRYQQIRDLVCTYRFANGKHALEKAKVELRTGEERSAGCLRFDWSITLELAGRGRVSDDPRAVRDVALTGTAIQDALIENRRERLAPLLARLGGIEIEDQRLRELVRRIIERTRRPPAPAPERVTIKQRWVVPVTAMTAERKPEADRLARRLASKGLRSYVAPHAQGVTVMVGPYDVRDPAVLATVAEWCPQSRPAWARMEER
jgi:hypothetical protein